MYVTRYHSLLLGAIMRMLNATRRWTCGLFVALLLLASSQAGRTQPTPAKRALTHADYDGWRTIQAPQLSRDGKFLAYLLAPQVGDRDVVIRNLASGQESRFTTGVAGGRLVFPADNRPPRFTVWPGQPPGAQPRKSKK